MEFQTFAKPLTEVLYARFTQDEKVKQMFLDIAAEDETVIEGIHDIQPSTARGYLSGTRSIWTPANTVIGHLDKKKFSDRVCELSDDAINLLLDAYAKELPEATATNIGTVLANEFANIIKESAGQKPRSDPSSKNSRAECAANRSIEADLFLETGGRCPLCGKAIGSQPAGKKGGYRIVSIVPLEAKKDYRVAKKYEEAVPRLPALGSPESRIALCFDCASNYENNPSVEKFERAMSKKKAMHAQEELTAKVASLDLDEELPLLLSKLGESGSSEELAQLSMEAVRVDDKIDGEHPLLRSKVTTMAIMYYKFIEEQGRLLEAQGILDFKELAAQVRLCYLTLRRSSIDQEEIFERICDWMTEKTDSKTRGACEVLTAFFVQNCVVFNASSK